MKRRFGILLGGLTLTTLLSTNLYAEISSAEVRARKISRLLSIYSQAVDGVGPDSDIVNEARDQKKEVLYNQSIPLDPAYVKARNLIAPLFKSDNARAITVNLINQMITEASEKLKAKILDPKSEALSVPEIVVGMGPQGAAYLQEKTQAAPNEKVLVVDSAEKPGGTFGRVGSAFALNSTNRKYEGERAVPGRGDLNNVHDIVGLPDYKGKRWTEAGGLGEVSSVGVYASNGAPLTQTEVISVQENTSGNLLGKYKVTMEDKVSKQKFDVYTDKVTFTTGIGKPRAFGDDATKELIENETKNAQRSNRIARIESFSDFANRIGNPDNREPIRDLNGKTVMIVGKGDSGRVVAEFLTGLAPEKAYKSDVAQVGRPEKIYWFLGLEGERKCADYIAQTRARYSQIAQAINSGVLIPVPGRVTSIGKEGQKQYTAAHQFQKENGEVVTRKSKIEYILPADERVGREKESVVKEKVVFDKIIYTTGFNNALPKVLEPLSQGVEFADVWKFKKAELAQFEGKEVNYAREHIYAKDITLAGPANESLGGLPLKGELAGVNANTVSLFANVERTKALARMNSEGLPIEGNLEKVLGEKSSVVEIDPKLTDKVTQLPEIKFETLEGVNRSSNVELSFRSALDFSLRNIRVKGAEQIDISIVKSESGKGFNFQIKEISLTPAMRKKVSDLITNNKVLLDVLSRDIMGTERSKVEAVDISVPVMESTGILKLREMVTTFRRRR